jgi:two-component system, sporulation sensor kinase E
MLADVISDGLRRQEAVEDLGRSEARYQRLVETPNLVVMLLDPIGEYIYLSPQISRWTGHEPDDFYSDPSLGRQMVHPDDHQRLDEATRPRLAR